MSDQQERIQKLLALAGNNPSPEEAAAAWAKAQTMIKQTATKQHRAPSDAELAAWFLEAAAPCQWVILVSRGLTGREYVAVVLADMLLRNKQTQQLPSWRVLQVPLKFRNLEASEILAACCDGRIAWRSLEAAA